MMAVTLTLATVLLVRLGSPAGEASPEAPVADAADADAARSEAARGETLFAEQRFEEASAAYERAYALDPFAPFLFARALCEQKAGRCEAAIDLYREFIATEPPQMDVDRANMEIGRCVTETAAAGPLPPPAEEVAIAQPADRPRPSHPPPPSIAWHRDPAGAALLSVGLVALASGLGLFLAGDASGRRADRAQTTDDFRLMVGRARALHGTGIAGISVGSGFIIGAIARYAIVSRKGRRARTR